MEKENQCSIKGCRNEANLREGEKKFCMTHLLLSLRSSSEAIAKTAEKALVELATK